MYHEAQGLDVTAQKTLGTTCTLPQSLHPDPSAPGSQVRKGVTKKKLLSVVASFEVEGATADDYRVLRCCGGGATEEAVREPG